MKKVFSSGSCRVLTTLSDGGGRFTPIHSIIDDTVNRTNNYLGWLYNTKQHIQFLRLIKGDLSLPDDILSKFLHAHMHIDDVMSGPPEALRPKYRTLREEVDDCDVFVFEICSIKRYVYKGREVYHGYHVLDGVWDEVTSVEQTEDEIYADLNIIKGCLPPNARLVLQSHFRPNVVFPGAAPIQRRELIYRALTRFRDAHPSSVTVYDPSVLLSRDPSRLFDGDVHFTKDGYKACFDELCALINEGEKAD